MIFLLWKTIAVSVLSDSSCREAINQAANTRLGENDQIRHLKTSVTSENNPFLKSPFNFHDVVASRLIASQLHIGHQPRTMQNAIKTITNKK